jgi:hypothetical protein
MSSSYTAACDYNYPQEFLQLFNKTVQEPGNINR